MSEQRREVIILAAGNMIAESGLAGLSIAAVARNAGFGPATVYSLFPAKNNLIAAVTVNAYSVMAARIRQAIGHDDPFRSQWSAAERLDTVVREFARVVLGERAFATALIHEPAGPEVVRERVYCRRDAANLVEEILRDGVESGELPEQPTALIAGAIVGALIEGLVGGNSPSSAELAGSPAGEGACVDALSRFVQGASGVQGELLAA
ncbi:TetR/AcrR family transcriptional regulator [Mycetocola saprophilus]|uniref:TetR/AcrR family transcriptional regulator n=1 Tax=Mycetocola saprophilus TaxID=76636 RepID=UPI0009DE5A1A|nr:TetR family transcriptional regulator [Mycetocola saprophilus]